MSGLRDIGWPERHLQPIIADEMPEASPLGDMPNPDPEMLADPRFEAIWQTIKSWDLNVPEYYGGYCGANGSHAALIFNALFAPKPKP